MLQRLLKLVMNADFLGLPITLRIDSQGTYKTALSFGSSLLIISIMLYSFSMLLQDIIIGKDPIVTSQIIDLQQNEGHTLDNAYSLVAVNVATAKGQIILNTVEKTYYTFEFTICNKNSTNTQCTTIPSEPCSGIWFDIANGLDMPQELIATAYCMSNSYLQTHDIRLQGGAWMNNYTDLSVKLLRCDPTKITNCATHDESDEVLLNSNLAYAYSYYQYNIQSSSNNHFSMKTQVETAKISPHYYKSIFLQYQFSQSIEEFNPLYFFPRTQTINSTIFNRDRIESSHQYLDDLTMADITFKLSNQKIKLYLSYPSILDVFAKLGGLFSLLKLLLSMIINPMQRILLKIYIYSQLQKSNKSYLLKQHKEIKQIKFCAALMNADSRDKLSQMFREVERHLDILYMLKTSQLVTNQIEFMRVSLNLKTPKHHDQRMDPDMMLTPTDQIIEIQNLKSLTVGRFQQQMNSCQRSARLSDIREQME